jgi:hypothetical protein
MSYALLNKYAINGEWSQDPETINKIIALLDSYDFYWRYIDNYGQMMDQKAKNDKIEVELRHLGVDKFEKI